MVGQRRILVTGASGFIGKELCRALVERGDQVVGLVRSPVDFSLPGVEFRVQDLEEPFDANQLVENSDIVIHLAGKAHGKGGADQQDSEAFERSNVRPTMQLAEAAVASGVRHFVFLSSIGVNGDRTNGDPITESSPECPHADYAWSKLHAETVLKDSLSGGQITYSIIRPTLVYGDGAPGNWGKLVRICQSAVPLPFGCAKNKRSLVSVSSLVSLIVLCTERPEAANQLFVAADEKAISTLDIVRCLRSGMGKKPALVPVPCAWLKTGLMLIGKGSVYQQLFGDLEVDATKAVTRLGWKRETGTSDLLRLIGERAA